MTKITKDFLDKYTDYLKVTYVIAISTIVFMCLVEYRAYDNTSLEVSFLDVGQGDSILIKNPQNNYFLIDTGPNYKSTQETENILAFFYDNLSGVLLTHPDLDHVGGTEQILKSLHVENLLISKENDYEDYKKYANFDTKYVKEGDKVYFSTLDTKDMSIEILNPAPGMLGDSNHKSIVSRIIYGDFEFIFMADADQEVERSLVAKGYFTKNKHIKVLKVGHHGSDTSSSELFLKTLKPQFCVISVGKDNSYGHPKPKTLETLNKYCGIIYRTDTDGTVKFSTDGKNLIIDRD